MTIKKTVVGSGQRYLVNNDNKSVRKDAGEGLLIAGAGGMVLLGTAALLPFVNALMVMIFATLAGLWMMVKK